MIDDEIWHSHIEVEAVRDGRLVLIKPEEMTTDDLCDALEFIKVNPMHEKDDAEAARERSVINEAIRRLREHENRLQELEAEHNSQLQELEAIIRKELRHE